MCAQGISGQTLYTPFHPFRGIMRQITFFCTLCFLSIVTVDGAAPAVILDSLSGKAEVQRAGSIKWDPIELNAKLFNNDVVRIIEGGVGRLQWPDRTVAFIRGGSQILVNIAPVKEKNRLFSYATVFVGSVFFVIRKIIPEKPPEDIQLYTPTTVISLRGTSFSVGVKERTGTTCVKVICGTVRVRCIKKNASAFISAPFKTVIDSQTAPITASALLSEDLDSLRLWVPPELIDREVAAHLARGKRDQMVISGRMEEKCIIMSFTNDSKYQGAWDIRHAIPRMLAVRLMNEHNLMDISAITDSAEMTPDDAAATKHARFVIRGTIAFFDIIDHAEITVRADEYHERSIGRITIDLHLYDADKKVEVFATTVTGERTGKKNSDNSWNTIGTLPFDLGNKQFATTIIGSALDQALDAAVERLTFALYQ